MSHTELLSGVMLPAVVWLLMLVIGMGLQAADFRRVFFLPRAVAAATIGQLLLVPLLTAALITLTQPSGQIAAGLVLLAAAPGAALSNVYVYFARADTALSVTLTALSMLLALLTMPLLVYVGGSLFLQAEASVQVPALRLVLQLVLMVLLPVAIGMALRHYYSSVVTRYARMLRYISLAALGVLVTLIIIDQAAAFVTTGIDMIATALLFSLLAMGAGWCTGRIARLAAPQCFALMVEFAIRNLAIVAVAGLLAFGDPAFIVFPTVCFLVQLPVVTVAAVIFAFSHSKPAVVTRGTGTDL